LSPSSVAPTIVNPLANAEVKELETGASEGSLGSIDPTIEKRYKQKNERNLKDLNAAVDIFKKKYIGVYEYGIMFTVIEFSQ